jgi:hypothetical protein
MFINWILIYTTPHIYPTHISHTDVFVLCFYATNKQQEFRLALREERQLLQSMAKDAVLVKPHGNCWKTIGTNGDWNQ